MQLTPIDIVFYQLLTQFLEALRAKGVNITPDTHIQLMKVLNGVSNKVKSPEILFDYICPLLAKSKEEQVLIKQEFDIYFNRSVDPEPVASYGMVYLAFAIETLIMLGLVCWILLTTKPVPEPIEAKYNIQSNDITQPVIFTAASTFKNIGDTIHANYIWNFGDGKIDSSGSATIMHKYDRPGAYSTSLTLRNRTNKFFIKTPSSAQPLQLCKPQFFLMSDVDYEISLGQSVRFYPNYDSAYPSSNKNIWVLNNKVVQRNAAAFTYQFDSAGVQTISYIDSGYNGNAACPSQADKPVYVKPPSSISLTILQTGDDLKPPVKFNETFRRWIMIFLLIFVSLTTSTWRKLFRKRKAKPIDANNIVSDFGGTKPPYQLPFSSRQDVIDDDPNLPILIRGLKRRIPDESTFVNIPKTIEETIKAEGFLSPHWSHRTRPAEYLVLIDHSKANSQQVKLYEYLTERFSKSDLYIEKFYFSENPAICINDQYKSGIHISKLYDIYPNHVLVLFGDGYPFIHKSYPSLHEALIEPFLKWRQVVLFTIKPYKDWNYKEQLLQQYFIVLPADLEGQLLLYALQEEHENRQENLNRLSALYQLQPYDLTDVKDLQKYLNDPFLFQWLCSIAIYPSLRWEVLLGLGDALQQAAFPHRSINYSLLLKLVRIDWMREGSMPDDTRLELLKALEPQNELIARKAMIVMMNEAATKLDKHSFVYEQMEVQRITDKFMLYAQNPTSAENQCYKADYQKYILLWKNNKVLDYPLTAYLQKKNGGNWSTLLGNKSISGNPVDSQSIDNLVAETNIRPFNTARLRRTLMVLQTIVFIIMGIIAAVYLFKKQIHESNIDKTHILTQVDESAALPITISNQPGACLSASQSLSDSTTFILDFGAGHTISLKAFDSTLTNKILYSWLANGPVKLTVRSKDNKYNLDTNIIITKNNIQLRFIGCAETCKNWQPEQTIQLSESLTGKWYDAGMTDGTMDFYTPLIIGQKSMGEEEIVGLSTCSDNKQMQKIITQVPSVSNVNQTAISDYKQYILTAIQGQQQIRISASDETYTSAASANSDTASQILLNKIRFSEAWQPLRNNAVFSDTATSIWQRNNTSTASVLSIKDNTIVYKNINWQIVSSSYESAINKYLYKAVPSNGKANAAINETTMLVILALNNDELLLCEKAPVGQNLDNQAATFYAFTKQTNVRNADIKKNVPIPAALTEIWTVQGAYEKIYFNVANKTIAFYNKGIPIAVNKMVEANLVAANMYQIILQYNSGQYEPIFIRNITQKSMEWGMCNRGTYADINSARAVSSNTCNTFLSGRLLYTNGNSYTAKSTAFKIELPISGTTPNGSESQKLQLAIQKFNSLNATQKRSSIIAINLNKFFRNTLDLTDRAAKIKSAMATSFNTATIQNTAFTGTAFQRDFIQITLNDDEPEDSTIYPDVITAAISQVGVLEDPPGSNRGKQVDNYLKAIGITPKNGGGYGWSAAFVYWCFAHTTAKNPLPKTGSSIDMWNQLASSYRLNTDAALKDPSQIKPGNVFFTDLGNGYGTCGIVVAVNGEYLETIEGNVNASRTEKGTGVYRRTDRTISSITKGFSNFPAVRRAAGK